MLLWNKFNQYNLLAQSIRYETVEVEICTCVIKYSTLVRHVKYDCKCIELFLSNLAIVCGQCG